MPMTICNHFHERLANNGKITTFTRVLLFDALVRSFPWIKKIETWTIEIYVWCWKFHMQLLHVYLNWFQCNSLLKCVSQPENTKISIKPLFWRSRLSKVIEFGGNWEPVYDFLLVINSYLGPISHHYWDTVTYWLKITNFSYPLSFSAFVQGDPLRIHGKA